jgi:hypothetical protein
VIFGKALIHKVLDGSKTQTRRPLRTTPDGAVKPCPYRPSSPASTSTRTYAVQRGRGGREVARVEVLEVRREPVGAITFADVRAEGFRTTAAFADYWLGLYDRAWPPTEPCDPCDGTGRREVPDATSGTIDPDAPAEVTCTACDGAGVVPVPVTADEVLDRFQAREGHKTVWVITFRLVDAPRLLAAAPSSAEDRAHDSDSDHGYTTNPARAVRDEPEAVDEATLDRITADAHTRAASRPGQREEALRRRAQSLAKRLRQLDGADTAAAGELDQIERHIEQLARQRGAGRTPGLNPDPKEGKAP